MVTGNFHSYASSRLDFSNRHRPPQHRVALEIIDDGYVRVAFYNNDRCLGVAYVNRARRVARPVRSELAGLL